MEKINRYDCGNGDGMFDDDTGYWVTYEDYKSLLDKYEDLVSKNESLHDVICSAPVRIKTSEPQNRGCI